MVTSTTRKDSETCKDVRELYMSIFQLNVLEGEKSMVTSTTRKDSETCKDSYEVTNYQFNEH